MIDPEPPGDPEKYRRIDLAGYLRIDPSGAHVQHFATCCDMFRNNMLTALRRYCIETSARYPGPVSAYEEKYLEARFKLDIFAITTIIKFFSNSMDEWWDLFTQCGEDWEKFMLLLEERYNNSGIKRSTAARQMASEAFMLEKHEVAKMYTRIADEEEAQERGDLPDWRR